MKRLSIISLFILLISLPGYSQRWNEQGWHQNNCSQCYSMAASLQLHPKQARDYEKIIHKYGQRIEKEARKDYRHWDKAARKIYDLRMDRDKKINRLLSPYQFDRYVHLTRERPGRIHELRGWYEPAFHNGHRNYRDFPNLRKYEQSYWSFHWNTAPNRKHKAAPAPKYNDHKYNGQQYNNQKQRDQKLRDQRQKEQQYKDQKQRDQKLKEQKLKEQKQKEQKQRDQKQKEQQQKKNQQSNKGKERSGNRTNQK